MLGYHKNVYTFTGKIIIEECGFNIRGVESKRVSMKWANMLKNSAVCIWLMLASL